MNFDGENTPYHVRSLSIILPVYKGENFIQESIRTVFCELKEFIEDFEVIVVVDGFEDKTFEKAKELEKEFSRLKIVGYEANRGKGGAIKYALDFVSMKHVAFVDADLDIHPASLERFMLLMKETQSSIVIGSKLHEDSRVFYKKRRWFASIGYRLLVKLLFPFIDARDFQTGMKLFRTDVLKHLFEKSLVKKFAFDLELLVIAHKHRYNIVEAPVNIEYKHDVSNVTFYQIKVILIDTLAVAYRYYIKGWYD